MRAGFDDYAVLEGDDAGGASDGCQAMGDD